MRFNRVFTSMVISMSLLLGTSQVAYALTYKDVPATHWAYEAVGKVSDMGYILGNLSGNFDPNGFIDKFDTVNILAKMAGYKDVGAAAAEQAYQDAAYEKYKSYITQFSSRFARWNSVRNKEIAFLLEKSILVQEDLNQFVILSNTGVEQLRALSWEEFATFLVKVMGKNEAALTMTASYDKYADDSKISAARKPYVYYLKAQGIVTGQKEGNNFTPNTAVTRAEAAYMISKAMSSTSNAGIITQPSSGTVAGGSFGTAGSGTVTNLETISGTISNLYTSIRSLQFTTANVNYNNKILRLSNTAEITVDGTVRTFSELKAGMSFVGIIAGTEIVKIAATSTGTAGTQIPDNNTPVITPAVTGMAPSELLQIDGTVLSISNAAGLRTVTIEVSMLDVRGQVYKENRSYTLASDCQILKDGKTVDFSAINRGDLVSGKYSGAYIYSMTLDEKDKEFTAELISKVLNSKGDAAIFTVEDEDGTVYELQVIPGKTDITRKGYGDVSWKEVRVGDELEIVSEYNEVTELHAIGEQDTAEGIITAIHISEDNSYIRYRDLDTGLTDDHPVISGAVDMYTLKLGSEIKVKLDSREISGINITRQAASNTITGYVDSITRTLIRVKGTDSSSAVTEIKYNGDTTCIDATNGKIIEVDDIDKGDQIYIIYDASLKSTAATITLLEEN